MNLDAFTIGIFSLFLIVTMIMILLGLKFTSRTYPGFENWIYGLMLLGSGYLLVGLRGRIDDFYSILIANIGIFSSVLFFTNGLEDYYLYEKTEYKRNRFLDYVLLSFFSCLFVVAYYNYQDARIRTMVGNVAIATLSFRAAILPFIFRKGITRVADRLMASGLLLLALIALFRVFFVLQMHEMRAPLEQDPTMKFSLFVGTAIVLFSNFSILNMINDRVQIELNQANKQLRALADFDFLTQAVTRRRFDQIADLGIKMAKRMQQPLSLILFDIDFFKKVNDINGHLVGDRVLVQLVIRTKEVLREVDTIARMGGEEFIVLLPQSTPETATSIASRIMESIGRVNEDVGIAEKITISCGIAGLRKEDKNIYDVITRADHLMYQAKDDGRNRLYVAE